MCINPQSRFVMMKEEATPGVAATPTPADDGMFVSRDSAGIKSNATFVDNNPSTPTGFQFASILGTIKPMATYRVPCYMKGITSSDIVVPRFASRLLASCGHLDFSVGSAAPTNSNAFDWTPDGIYPRSTAKDGTTVTAAKSTLTIFDYLGRSGSEAAGSKTLWKMVGSTVSKVTLTVTIGGWVFLDFELLGQYVEPVISTADISSYSVDGVSSDFVVPFGAAQRMTFADASTADFEPSSTVWSIDFQAAQEESDKAGGFGVGCVSRKQAVITFTTNPMVQVANFGKWAEMQTEAQVASYSMEGSMTVQGRTADTGYTIRASAPQVQGTWELNDGTTLRKDFSGVVSTPDGPTPPFTLSFS